MSKHTRRAGVLTLAIPFTVALAACDFEVQNPGAILDDDLNTPELMPVLVAGVASEFNDFVDDLSFDVARLTDEMAGTGSYFDTGRYRRGVYDDEDSEGNYEQVHESVWTAGVAWDRLQEVLGEGARGALSARVFMLQGFSHRFLGENFCEVTYDIGGLQPREAAFDSAIVAFETALEHAGADAAGADLRTASYAGLAQAYVGKGDWASAASAAANVPTSFELSAIYHLTADQNVIFDETHDRAELGVYATLAASFDPDQDARAPYVKCGEFKDPNDPSQGVNKTNAPGCTAHQGADGLTAHWKQLKYDEDGSDIAVAKGTEMRLIEAEAALIAGDLATFTTKVNEVRSHYGIDPIGQPAAAGSLEFPNALDDAWSILDAERWLTLWLEGRRLWDLYRWDHPFLDGGSVVYPGEARRAWCMPIPEIECQLNQSLRGATLQTSTGGTTTCG